MKIATFNVKDLLPGVSAERVNQIQRLIERIDADILCLQEIGSPELLADITPGYQHRHIGTPDMRGIATALISREPMLCTNWNIDASSMDYFTASAVGELSKYPGRSFVTGVASFDGKQLNIVGVHLKASRPMTVRDASGNKLELVSHELVARGRVRTGIQKLIQAHAIRKHVDELFEAAPDAQVVVLGDFNDYQYSIINRIIEGDADFCDGPGILRSVADMIPEIDRFSHLKSNGAKRFIDSILLSNSLYPQVRTVEVYNSHLTTDTPWSDLVSDHAPVVVTL